LCVYIPPERKEYKTKFNLTPDEWERIKNPLLKDMTLRTIKNDISEIENKARKALDGLIKPTFESFVEEYSNQVYNVGKDPYVGDWFDKCIDELKRNNNSFSYQENLKTAKNSLLAFKKKLRFSHLTEDFLTRYWNKMLAQGSSEATIQSYLRALRKVVNFACKNRAISKDLNPFGVNGFTVGTTNSRKDALNKEQIHSLLKFELPEGSKEDLARDIFIFQYLSNGMNINDLCKLKEENLKQNGQYIEFIRTKTKRMKKTQQTIIAYVCPESQAVMKKWGNKNRLPSDYIFPFYNTLKYKDINTGVERYKLEKITSGLNECLKIIGNQLHITFPLTTGIARHSYATILKNEGIGISLIKDGMGHSSSITTEGYLKSADTEIIKKMSEKLL
jgi:site-specific recombinase XerD